MSWRPVTRASIKCFTKACDRCGPSPGPESPTKPASSSRRSTKAVRFPAATSTPSTSMPTSTGRAGNPSTNLRSRSTRRGFLPARSSSTVSTTRRIDRSPLARLRRRRRPRRSRHDGLPGSIFDRGARPGSPSRSHDRTTTACSSSVTPNGPSISPAVAPTTSRSGRYSGSSCSASPTAARAATSA